MLIRNFVDLIESSTSGRSLFAEALSIKEHHLPKRIYRYRPDCSDSRRNLETDTVWLSSPASYNDPYDCWFRFSQEDLLVALENRLVDILAEQGKLQGVSAAQIEKAKRDPNPLKMISGHIPDFSTVGSNLRQIVEFWSTQTPIKVKETASSIQSWRKLTKVCSFSEINSSLLMWAHYADNHRGFCVEYNIEGLRADHRLRETLYPVVYTSHIYDLTRWALTLVTPERQQFNTELPILCVIHKCRDWKYEKEWRMVRVTPTEEPDQNCLVPTPTRIFLGSMMGEAKLKELRTVCLYKGIEVWQMHLAEDKFKLLPERLD